MAFKKRYGEGVSRPKSMNNIIKLVFGWYLLLTLLALLGATTLAVADVVLGLAFMWVLFLFFGCGIVGQVGGLRDGGAALRFDRRLYAGMTFIACICAVYSAFFYTGKSVPDVLAAASFKVSNYNDYQAFNSENELTNFSANQILPFFAVLVFKFWMLFCFITILVGVRTWSFWTVFFLGSAACPQLYYSLARGTGFEYFELLFLVWYCFALRSSSYKKERSVGASKAFVIILSALFLFVFLKGFTSRYESELMIECATTKICIDADSLWFSVSDSLALLTYTLSGYFTFGIYFLSVFIGGLFGVGVADPVYYFMPLNIFAVEGIRDALCGRLLDCGVAWVPDVVAYVQWFGFPALFFILYLLGRLSYILLKKVGQEFDFLKLAVLYYCVLAMFSLPVGNFITASVPNVVILVCILAFLVWQKYFKNRNFFF